MSDEPLTDADLIALGRIMETALRSDGYVDWSETHYVDSDSDEDDRFQPGVTLDLTVPIPAETLEILDRFQRYWEKHRAVFEHMTGQQT